MIQQDELLAEVTLTLRGIPYAFDSEALTAAGIVCTSRDESYRHSTTEGTGSAFRSSAHEVPSATATTVFPVMTLYTNYIPNIHPAPLCLPSPKTRVYKRLCIS